MKHAMVKTLPAGEIKKLARVTEANDALPARRIQGTTLMRAIMWGIFSLGAYLLLFLNQEAVTRYFTKGGIFALVIIITALAFSLIHGSFAGYVLEILGIRPLRHDKD